jgi:hypothetical protein
MGLREVKTELNKLDKADLIKHISELYKKYQPVRAYFDFYVNPDEEKLLEEYKDKVREGFYPRRGFALNLSISRKAINDFKKLATSKESLVILLLYYVECGVEFTNEFGDIDENFYSSIENAFVKALDISAKERTLEKFKGCAYKIVEDTRDIGWGFHDYLGDVYSEYYD